jgi:hypothetical protein
VACACRNGQFVSTLLPWECGWERAERILRKLQPASDLAGSIEAVTPDALRMRRREVVNQLGAFEARYGRTFEQFAADRNGRGIRSRRM